MAGRGLVLRQERHPGRERRRHEVEELYRLFIEVLEAVTRASFVLVGGEVVAEAAVGEGGGGGGRRRGKETK